MSYEAWAIRGANTNYVAAAKSAAAKYGVPVDLYTGLIQSESSWRPNVLAQNKDGTLAKNGGGGIAQFVKGTARDMGIDRMNPYQSLDAGAKYLRQRFDLTGSWGKAVKLYKGQKDLSQAGNVAVFDYADKIDAQQKGVSAINANPVPSQDNSGGVPAPSSDAPAQPDQSGSFLDIIKQGGFAAIFLLIAGIVIFYSLSGLIKS